MCSSRRALAAGKKGAVRLGQRRGRLWLLGGDAQGSPRRSLIHLLLGELIIRYADTIMIQHTNSLNFVRVLLIYSFHIFPRRKPVMRLVRFPVLRHRRRPMHKPYLGRVQR